MSGKKIAKNSFFLYIRMFITMGVALYTSRIVLNILGINDYGIYSVVGGVVSMFGFFNMAMSSATQRFLSFDIGKGNINKLKVTFSTSVIIHLIIAVVVLILAESIGLWFLNNKLNINPSRSQAALYVYQFSILSFVITILQVPYNALIIAKQRMNVYALLSICDIVLKLFIVYLLLFFELDKLKLYSFLSFSVAFLIFNIYRFYCVRFFPECRFKWIFNKDIFSSMLNFSGWSLFGNLAAIARGQGSNVLLNIFFGTSLNAAFGITSQVNSAVKQFVSSFQIALNPQIVQTYARGEIEENHKLILQGSKLSFFLLLVVINPIWLNIDFLLSAWLENVPEYTSTFIKLALLNLLIDSISGPLMVSVQATGKIKWYQITIGGIMLFDLPFTFFILREFKIPEYSYLVTIVITCTTLVFRLIFLKALIKLNAITYFKNVIIKILLVGILAGFVNYVITKYFIINIQLLGVIILSFIVIILNCIIIFFVGLKKDERKAIKTITYEKIYKGNKK